MQCKICLIEQSLCSEIPLLCCLPGGGGICEKSWQKFDHIWLGHNYISNWPDSCANSFSYYDFDQCLMFHCSSVKPLIPIFFRFCPIRVWVAHVAYGAPNTYGLSTWHLGPQMHMGRPYAYGARILHHTCIGYPVHVWAIPYAYGAKYA